MSGYKNILFSLLLLALFIPMVQQVYPVIPQRNLKGAVVLPDYPDYSPNNVFSGQFQKDYAEWYEFHAGLRPFLIRLRNQIYYGFFGETGTAVRPGKAGQFYSWDYWSAYRGYDGFWKDTVANRVERLAELRDSLENRNKKLLCVIAPNKVRILPGYLPPKMSAEPGNKTYYNWYKQDLRIHGIPLLDLNKYFQDIKDTVLKPLFANTSIHWSGYGMNLGISKIIDSLEVLGQRDHVNMRYAKWVMKDSVISSDRDMVDLLNILFEPETEPLAFPVYDMEQSTQDKRARVLIIGDSFFWNFYSFDVRFDIFHPSSRFWYYNSTEYDLEGVMKSVSDLSASETVENVDYVVIMATEANLSRFPFGFASKYLQE